MWSILTFCSYLGIFICYINAVESYSLSLEVCIYECFYEMTKRHKRRLQRHNSKDPKLVLMSHETRVWFSNKPAVAVRKTASADLGYPYKDAKKPFFGNRTIDCRRTIHQNWPKIIYSLTYSTSKVYILKIQLKLNCLIGLAVMVLFAHAATANCKLQRIQCEPCS